MKPYSEDLRRRIVKAVREGGVPKCALARLFDVTVSPPSSATRGGSLTEEPLSNPGRGAAGPRRWWTRDHGEASRRGRTGAPGGRHRLRKTPPLPGAAHRQGFERPHHKAGPQAAGLQPKKRALGAPERDEWLRAAWRVMVARKTAEPKRPVLVDEMGTNTSLSPLRAWWSRRGERARAARCPVTVARTPRRFRA